MSQDGNNSFGSRESRMGREPKDPSRDAQDSSRESQELGRGFGRLGQQPQHCRGSGPPNYEEISRLYAAGELRAEEASTFEAHLAECEKCRESVREWRELFSVLSAGVHFEPAPEFDVPVLAFVERLVGVGARERERVANRRFAWVAGFSAAAVFIVLVTSLRGALVVPAQTYRYLAMGTTWVVDAFERGVESFVFYLINSLKLGEILIGVSEAMDPIWNSLRLAAGHVDHRLVALEILLFLLTLFLLRGLVASAQKGRCSHVGIIA